MRADIGYERTLGVHDFSAIGAFRYTKNEMTGMTQDFKDANISLRLNYSYDKRYLAELTLAVMGSNKFDTKRIQYYLYSLIHRNLLLASES